MVISSLLPSFYEQLKPRYAVISVGENNPFGHPYPAVMEMLAQQGIKIFRTDQDGAIMVHSNGKDLTITPTIVRNE